MEGVKALYGIPLLYGDELIGVVKMGSRTASDFPAEDRLILRSIAERAAAFIALKRVAEDRELYLHVLGHDLRSPLQGILLHTQMLARQDHSQEAARRIDRIHSAAARMGRLIGDITDFTQTRMTGTLPLETEKLDLADLVEQVRLESEVRGKRDLRIARVGDVMGEWDGGRLVRMIVNLVNNAFAYGKPSTPVDLRLEGQDGCVMLRVHNEGEPIPEELKARLFEPFKRGAKGVGSGLGLYIAQQIVRAHGGRIEIDSAAGRGTTFSVRLPRRVRRARPPPSAFPPVPVG
jgi:phosphoserine phosphatase RsbU/P